MTHRPTILSGMRPTGKLHLGHLVGALENWVSLQGTYDNYHLIADYHALTTNLDSSHLTENSLEMVIDWIACGIDPVRSPIFRQSQIKEHAELHLILSMLITAARLERNPAVKDQVRDLKIENITYGHLGYPVLQAADILLYKGELVPVGEDQVPHVEISREIARRFNNQYGVVFPEPEPKLTTFSRLPGLDGNDRKMSKSSGNTILLSDSPVEIGTKLRGAVTDPQKVRKNDPGRPEICLVYTYHKKFNAGESASIAAGCRSGVLGCVECKQRIAKAIATTLEPVREKRALLEERPDEVRDVLADGERRARARGGDNARRPDGHEAGLRGAMTYRVKLTEFEGPLDLLLFFIKRDELDIQNIPISRITQEFLEYLHLMASLDLEVAGEFIVMAAELMQIKVRMLLPRDEHAVEEEDPRAELVRRLIEYKRYKEMSLAMGSMEAEQRKIHYRRFFHADTRLEPAEDPQDSLKEISLFNLIASFKVAMDHMPKKVVHEVTLLSVTVDEQTSYVLDFLRVHGPTTLLRLVAHMTEKIRMIVTVIALLELTKNKVISLAPTDGADDITIRMMAQVVPFQAGAPA